MDRRPSLLIDPSLDPSPVRAALVWASGLPGCPPTQVVPEFLQALLDRVLAGEETAPAARKAAVRNMLRHGARKPAGRSKPASEYLRGAALASQFPLVNGPGESYAFNAAGQTIELNDLLCVCRREEGGTWVPCGNPVKDSMATKIGPATAEAAAVR